MAKKAIRLNEAQLRNLIAKSVKRAIKEDYEKSWGDAMADRRAEGEGQLAWQYLQSCKQAFNELKSHFQASMKIIGKIDPTNFAWYSDDIEGFLNDMYDFLEDNEHKIDELSSGEFLLTGKLNI